MAQRDIREYTCKSLFHTHWETYFKGFKYHFNSVLACSGQMLKDQTQVNPWLNQSGLVVKPDMLFGKRGKNNLVYLKEKKAGDVNLKQACEWIEKHNTQETTLLSGISGVLSHYIVEPFAPHDQEEEYYISARTDDYDDILVISPYGGIEVEENWDKTTEIRIPLNLSEQDIASKIEKGMPNGLKNTPFTVFATQFYAFFKDLHFCYLELNPVVIKDNTVYLLDAVAKVDDTAKFLITEKWGPIEFPSPFGMRPLSAAEERIKALDEESGSSLKLTILNPYGRLWTLVAGGGASVVYADTIDNAWGISELANYGEYSGNPTTEETYIYTKTLLELMVEHPREEDKILIIGGAIANFTDVAKTFAGIIQALEEFAPALQKNKVKTYVRRGGPNYEKGLKLMEAAGERLHLPIQVYGPNTHITDIIRMALEEEKEGVVA